MSFISKIKKQSYQKSIALLIKKNQVKRHNKMTFSASKKVLLLFDASQISTQKEAQKYKKHLKELGKSVSLFGFFNDKENRENIAFPFYNKKNIDWAGRVKGEEITTLLQDQYDLLINIDLNTNETTEHLICQIDAKLKAGPVSNNIQVYDLMIDPAPSSKIQTFLQQIEFFLKKLNIRTPVAV